MKTKEEVVQEFRIQAIREAAGRVVAEKGTEGATMEAIAEAAGIAKGTIYLYFKNREDLLDQTADFALTSLLEEIGAVFEQGVDFRRQLATFVERTLLFFATNRDFFRLYRAVHEQAGRCHDREQHPRYRRYLEVLTQWITTASQRGEVADGDPALIARLVSESIHAVSMQWLREAAAPTEDAARWLSSLLLDGIAARRKEP